MDLWDWLAGLLNVLFGGSSSLRLWLLLLLAILVVWWLKVPYFRV